MADQKLTALTADTTPSSDDLMYTVNDPGGTPASRKVTLADHLGFIQLNTTLNQIQVPTAAFSMNSKRLTNLASPTTSGDALSIGSTLGLFLPTAVVSGGTLTGASIRSAQSILLSGSYTQTVLPTDVGVKPGVSVNWNSTLSDTGSGVGPLYSAGNSDAYGPVGIYDANGTIRYGANMAIFNLTPISYASVIRVANNASAARTLVPGWTFMDASTVYADGATVTLTQNDVGPYDASFIDYKAYGTGNTGTLSASTMEHAGFMSAPVVLGNTTLGTRVGFDAFDINWYGAAQDPTSIRTLVGSLGIIPNPDANAITLTNNIGVNIRDLTAGTVNIGLRNASTTVETPKTSTLSAVSSTIINTASTVVLNNTSGGALTLTSTPPISTTNAQNGQRLNIVNGSSNSVTITDSTGVQLVGYQLTLRQGDAALFVYNSTLSKWCEITMGSKFTETVSFTDPVNGAGQRLDLSGGSVLGPGISFFLSGDTNARTGIASGAITFGPGNTAADVSLARTGVGVVSLAGSTFDNFRPKRRVLATAGPGATPTYNTDSYDSLHFTALAANITSMTTSATGTPNSGDELHIDFTDNGTARTIAWGANFEASGNIALPTTTVISTRLDVKFRWNIATSKWRCMGVA